MGACCSKPQGKAAGSEKRSDKPVAASPPENVELQQQPQPQPPRQPPADGPAPTPVGNTPSPPAQPAADAEPSKPISAQPQPPQPQQQPQQPQQAQQPEQPPQQPQQQPQEPRQAPLEQPAEQPAEQHPPKQPGDQPQAPPQSQPPAEDEIDGEDPLGSPLLSPLPRDQSSSEFMDASLASLAVNRDPAAGMLNGFVVHGGLDYDGGALDALSDLDDVFAEDSREPAEDKPEEDERKIAAAAEKPGPGRVTPGNENRRIDRPTHVPSRTVMVSAAGEPASAPHHNHNSLSSLSMFSENPDDDLSFMDEADDPPTVLNMVNSGQFSCFALRMQELDNVRAQVHAHGRQLQLPENLRLLKELAQVLQVSKIRCKSAHRKGHLDDQGWLRLEQRLADIVRELEDRFLEQDPKLLGVLRTNLSSGIRAGTLPAARDMRRPALGILADEPLSQA